MDEAEFNGVPLSDMTLDQLLEAHAALAKHTEHSSDTIRGSAFFMVGLVQKEITKRVGAAVGAAVNDGVVKKYAETGWYANLREIAITAVGSVELRVALTQYGSEIPDDIRSAIGGLVKIIPNPQ